MIIICNKSFQDLIDDSVVENTGCSSRAPYFTPSTQTVCNSSSSGSDTFFWLLRALNTDGA